MFVCSATSALHVEFMDTYSTDSFLMALHRFMCVRGVPSRIQYDRGEQLVAASKQLAAWDLRGSRSGLGRMKYSGISFSLVDSTLMAKLRELLGY
jgi:hypothetical protein